MNVAILGYGEQNKVAYNYWKSLGNDITVCDVDERIELPPNTKSQLGSNYLESLARFDLLIRSPGVHPSAIVKANGSGVLSKTTTVTNEFFRVCPTKNIIGVTGTKGKGTTSTLIAKILEKDGKRVHIGGNIGIPPLTMLEDGIETDDWVIVELANFQLIDLKYSPHIGVCLMVVPEHLDWHDNLNEYITAKQQMFITQTNDDIAIFFAENEASVRVASVSKGQKIPFFKQPGALVKDGSIVINDKIVCRIDEIKLLGEHNWQNICAAVTTAWQITKNTGAIHSAISSFSGLEHRLEFVRELDNIKFYNDSFAATPDAATAAVEAIHGEKVMIMGGFDRQLPLDRFVKYINDNSNDIRKILLVGQSSGRVAQEFEQIGFTNYIVEPKKSMDLIVSRAKGLAHSGDSVVLSPGFASFDMFKNFEERGQKYKEAVNKQ